jgi:hypothetical protein
MICAILNNKIAKTESTTCSFFDGQMLLCFSTEALRAGNLQGAIALTMCHSHFAESIGSRVPVKKINKHQTSLF